MNLYRTSFWRRCPVDGAAITYRLEIRSSARIMAEDIVSAVNALPSPILHEDAADEIARALGGEQTLVAMHGAVEIETHRKSEAK